MEEQGFGHLGVDRRLEAYRLKDYIDCIWVILGLY